MYSTRYDHATAAAEHGCPQGATRPRRGHAGDPDRRVPGGPVGPDGCLRPQGGRDRGVPAGGRRLPAPPPLPARLGTAPRASLCHGRLAGGRVLPDARPWSARHRAGADRVRPGALRRPADPGPPAVAPSDDRAPLVRRPAGGGTREPFPDVPGGGAPRVGLASRSLPYLCDRRPPHLVRRARGVLPRADRAAVAGRAPRRTPARLARPPHGRDPPRATLPGPRSR